MIRKQESRRTALVIGCGIGGPVAAMALQQAGIEPKIFEARAESADFAGLFLNLASNGLDALDAIHAQDSVLAQGFPTPRMVMWSGSGKRLGEVANGITLSNGATSMTVDRGTLHSALRNQAIARGITIVSGKRLVGAEPAKDGVVARFADGSEEHGRLLIGVDGIHSQTRRIIDPAAPAPRYTGQLSLGGRARLRTVSPTPNTFNMIFGRRAFFGYSVPALGDVLWFANVSFPEEPTRDRLAAIPAGQWKQTLIDLFAGDAGPAAEIVGATAAGDPRGISHSRHAGCAHLAPRCDGAPRGRGACDLAELRAGGVDGHRGCHRPGEVSAGLHERCRGVRCLRAGAPRPCSARSRLFGPSKQHQDRRTRCPMVPRSDDAGCAEALCQF